MNETLLNTAIQIYFVLAIGYNLVSLLLEDIVGRKLAPTDPVPAILMMTVLYLVYSSITLIDFAAWNALMLVYVYLILRFGIFRHVIGYSADLYLSRSAWFSAISINVFGVLSMSLKLIAE